MLTPERRCEVLADIATDLVVELADRVLDAADDPTIVRPPQAGTVMLTVREPVETHRFHLGEVLVTQAEIEHRGARGWSMRLGDDQAGALAAAVLDAEAAALGPFAPAVDELCACAEVTRQQAADAEWRELEPTVVSFEELD